MFIYFRLFIYVILYFPLTLLYVGKNKELFLEDIKVMYKNNRTPLLGFWGYLYLMAVNPYFRRLCYTRIGKMGTLLNIFYPAESTFLLCKNIGQGIYLAHPFATIVNAKSVGKNLTIRNNTTIGNKEDGNKESRPELGDNVTIGANVVVIGKIRIGNNVTIGAGSVVIKDVPDNAIVAGNPARVIRYKE